MPHASDTRLAVAHRAAWALLEQFAWPISLLVCIPILIARLGVTEFGLFSLTLTVLGMSTLLSVGVGALTARNVAMAAENGQPQDEIEPVRSALGAVVACGGAITIATAIAVPLLSETAFARLGDPGRTSVALFVGLACALMQEFDVVFSMAVKGRSRFRPAALLEWVGRGVWALLTAFAVNGGADLETVLIITLLSLALKCALKAAMAVIVFGDARIIVPLITRAAMRPLLSASRWLWVQNISGLLLMSADRLIVGAVFGPAVLGRYTACTQLAQFAFVIPATAGQALLPWLARHLRDGTSPDAGWSRALFGLALASCSCGVLLAVGSSSALTLWLGRGFAAENASLLAALAAGCALLAFSVPYHYAQLGAGNARLIGVANAIGAVICVGAIVLAAPFGLLAFAIARAAYALPLLSYTLKSLDPIFPTTPATSSLQRKHP